MRPILFILILGIAASAWAAYFFLGGLAEDENMIIRREFSEDVQRVEPEAVAGNSEAQTALGLLYLTSDELVRDPGVAAEWLERAAKQGNARAQYLLGNLYENGTGVPQDFSKAAKWYDRSAKIGRNPNAEYALGRLYTRGLGVGYDTATALEWYRKAAEGNQPTAQYLVGRVYEFGYGVRQDMIQAYVWYSLSSKNRETVIAENSDYDPAAALARLAGAMNRSQIDAADKVLKQWKPTH